VPAPWSVSGVKKWQNENYNRHRPVYKKGYGDKFLPQLENKN
jgi:hypothetical protein